jgi:hypothetical protein
VQPKQDGEEFLSVHRPWRSSVAWLSTPLHKTPTSQERVLLKRDAEKDLRQAMDDIDALERGEIRVKPTTAQEAFEIYKRNQDIRGQAKSYNYRANNEAIYKILRDFVKHFGPNRLIRDFPVPTRNHSTSK